MSHPIYNAHFYKRNKNELYISAQTIVPLIMRLLKPKSVVDVGCGLGTWLKVFEEHGVKDILGIDGEYIHPAQLLIPRTAFLAKNVAKPLAVSRTFDMAISLEVAEHLPAASAKNFIKNLTSLSDIIVFSAAVPGQADAGIGHVNEQWPSYWQDIFQKHGYLLLDPFRPALFHASEVAWWYRQNILLAVKKRKYSQKPFHDLPLYNEELMIVHRAIARRTR